MASDPPAYNLSMSYTPAVIASPVYARSRALTAALVVSVAALTAFAAQWFIPLWPVPVTGQTLVILLGGAALGWRAGAAAQVLYLVVGALGAPVFSEASRGLDVLWGPTATTAGYLFAFPVAAALVGWLAERRHDRSFWTMVGAFAAGSAVIYLGGMTGLMMVLGVGPAEAFSLGVWPFLVGDALKATAAGILLPAAWRLVR